MDTIEWTKKASDKLSETDPELCKYDLLVGRYSEAVVEATKSFLITRTQYERPTDDVEELRNLLIYQIFICQELLFLTPIFHVCKICENPEGQCVDFKELKNLVDNLNPLIQQQGKWFLHYPRVFGNFFKSFLRAKAPTAILGDTSSAEYLEGLLNDT